MLYRTDRDEQTFDWLDQPEDDRALIVWDLDTNAGSIEADTYNGGERACWDSRPRGRGVLSRFVLEAGGRERHSVPLRIRLGLEGSENGFAVRAEFGRPA